MHPSTPQNHTSSAALEHKIEQLSRDVKRQKFLNMALFVGALVAVGATQVVSQTQIKSMAVTTLQIVDSKGKVKAFLSADPSVNKTGATLSFLDERGSVRALLAYDGKNSMVSFMGAGKNSEPMAMLGYCDDAGIFSLANQNSQNGATILAQKELGGLVFTGPKGKEAFSLEVDENGGQMKVFDAAGKERPFAAPNSKNEAVKIEGAALRKGN